MFIIEKKCFFDASYQLRNLLFCGNHDLCHTAVKYCSVFIFNWLGYLRVCCHTLINSHPFSGLDIFQRHSVSTKNWMF